MLMLKLRSGSSGVARFPLLLSLALASLALGACAPGVDTAAAGSTSSTLAISGTPATSVVAGQSYSFVPSTTNPGGMKLAFSISNKPSWATFSASTGELLGTPADTDVGTYPNIEISVDDGPSSVALAVFGLAVTAPATTAGAPPTISGSPATGVVGGQSYSFTPTTTDPSGCLQYRYGPAERHACEHQRRRVLQHPDQRERRDVERGITGIRHHSDGCHAGPELAADDFGQPRDQRRRGSALLIHPDHDGPEREAAHLLDQ